MIRKIILVIFLLFTIYWFAGAYIAKNTIVANINSINSDNIKFSYSNIEVSGFPFKWQVEIFEPKIKLIQDQYLREFSTQKVLCLLDYSLKTLDIDIGSNFKHHKVHETDLEEYLINSSNNIFITIKFSKSLYNLEEKKYAYKLIKNLYINNDILSINYQDSILFQISNLSFMLDYNQIDPTDSYINAKLYATYIDENENLSFKQASLDLDSSIKIIENKVNNLDIYKLNLNLDQTSEINLLGQLAFPKKFMEFAQGNIEVELINYEDFIDKTLSEEYFKSSVALKNLIIKAASNDENDEENVIKPNELSNNLKFNIIFAEDEVRIGSLTLKDFYNLEEQ